MRARLARGRSEAYQPDPSTIALPVAVTMSDMQGRNALDCLRKGSESEQDGTRQNRFQTCLNTVVEYLWSESNLFSRNVPGALPPQLNAALLSELQSTHDEIAELERKQQTKDCESMFLQSLQVLRNAARMCEEAASRETQRDEVLMDLFAAARGAFVNAASCDRSDIDCEKFLLVAVTTVDVQRTVAALHEGADVNFTWPGSHSALTVLASCSPQHQFDDAVRVAEALLGYGINPGARSEDGTALFLAALTGNLPLMVLNRRPLFTSTRYGHLRKLCVTVAAAICCAFGWRVDLGRRPGHRGPC